MCPRQSAPRQSVLPQSATHAKVPLTPKCPFMLICQSGIHANVALCQSCTHAKVVIRQNVRVKVFHAKVFYAKMSVSPKIKRIPFSGEAHPSPKT